MTTYWRSANGKVHSRVEGRGFESDNLDAARLERIGSLVEVDLSALCLRCFPVKDRRPVAAQDASFDDQSRFAGDET